MANTPPPFERLRRYLMKQVNLMRKHGESNVRYIGSEGNDCVYDLVLPKGAIVKAGMRANTTYWFAIQLPRDHSPLRIERRVKLPPLLSGRVTKYLNSQGLK
jgi:hypothetical protein